MVPLGSTSELSRVLTFCATSPTHRTLVACTLSSSTILPHFSPLHCTITYANEERGLSTNFLWLRGELVENLWKDWNKAVCEHAEQKSDFLGQVPSNRTECKGWNCRDRLIASLLAVGYAENVINRSL